MPEPDRTETATPKKREDVRKKGQVARSVEINSVLNVLIVFIVLNIFGNYIIDNIKNISISFWSNLFSFNLNADNISNFVSQVIFKIILILLPVFIAAFLVAIISNLLQVGFNISFEPLKPNLDNINPMKGLQRIFSKRMLVELLKAFLKIAIIGYVFYGGIKKIFNDIFLTPLMDINTLFIFITSITYNLAMKIVIAFIIFAFIDYLYQRWEFEQNIKMTKQEIKDEMKQLEGDPLIKVRIRNIQREMARRRMISEIPKADVVITNPTHIAVALSYNEKENPVPLIIAKGLNFMAEKIKKIAKDNKIPIVENRYLAKLLVEIDVGREIPFELFQTVAEILAYVYQIKGKIKLDEISKKVDNKNINIKDIQPSAGGS